MRLRFVSLREQGRKFGAAEAGEGEDIGDHVARALCHLFQQPVAAIVTQRVVHFLEPLEVEESQHHHGVVGIGFSQIREDLVDRAAVAPTRERIEPELAC